MSANQSSQITQNIGSLRSRGALAQVVKNRRGQTYRLFIAIRGDRHALTLYDGATWVGEARCSWQQGSWMVLDDIAIANQAAPALNLLERLQQWIWSVEFEPVNYRQQGLGTLLLDSTINHARKMGATSLRGEVFQADMENNPALMTWYERHGFVQSAPRAEQIDVFANISLDLRSAGQREQVQAADTLF